MQMVVEVKGQLSAQDVEFQSRQKAECKINSLLLNARLDVKEKT